MSNIPGFNEIFHPYYDKFSVKSSLVQIPDHFDIFTPDNNDDFECISIITPNVSRGSKKWTINGNWVTIGIYRDEGRPISQRPAVTNLNWTRSGKFITILENNTPLDVGDDVTIYNSNTPQFISKVFSKTQNSFTVIGSILGDVSGSNCAYLMKKETNFFQDYRVFRLLPSFKLITFETLLEIINDASPEKLASRRSLHNITLEKDVLIPNSRNRSTNYELPVKKMTKSETMSLQRRFGQLYDEIGDPLQLSYQSRGYPIQPNVIDSKHKNDSIMFNQPLSLENGHLNNSNSRIYAFDYYGADLNDPQRGPFYDSNNVVAGEKLSSTGIANISIKRDNMGYPIYNGKVFDEYGNIAIGVNPFLNTLITRKAILPLTLDHFNRPIKKPV